MTPLDEIKRIRDAATPGPWTPGKTWRTIQRAEIAAEEAASLAAANESLLARAETLLWQLEQRADFGARLDDERVAAEQRVAELEEALRKIERVPNTLANTSVTTAIEIARAALRGSSDD